LPQASARRLEESLGGEALILEALRARPEAPPAPPWDAPVPLCVVRGPDLRVEAANDAFQALAGAAPVVGRPVAEALPGSAGPALAALLREAAASGQSRAGAEVGMASGAEATWWRFTAAPLGAPGRVLAIGQDVTALLRERDELRAREAAARREAEDAGRAKEELLAILGHELRNPLAPIRTALELMRLQAPDVALRERTAIERQVGHLARLVDDLLDASRIIRGRVELRRKPVELAQVVAAAVERAGPLLESRGQRLTLAVPLRGLCVDADEVRLAQAVAHLLGNAARYSAPGGPITVRAVVMGDQVVLSVRDEGAGIDPDLLPRIFEPFVQGPRTIDRAAGGLGLGLAIVRGLVALHGGTVTAHSEGPGLGAELVVRLPRLHTAASPEAAPELTAPPRIRPARRVLVVDDNRDAAELLADALRMHGHEVRVAFDGPAALAVAIDFRPQFALLDIGLPVMDGHELAVRLAQRLPDPPRLVELTAYGLPPDRERTRRAGFETHLVKPVDVETVRDLLARRLDDE
jgi:signal transduction histidine kinase